MVILPATFFLIVATVSCLVLRYIASINNAAKVLEAAYKNAGQKWSFWRDTEFRRKLLLRPDTIRATSDDANVQKALLDILRVRSSMKRVLLLMSIVAIVAGPALIIAGLADIYWQNGGH